VLAWVPPCFFFFVALFLLSLCFCPAGFDHTTVNTTRHRHDFCARPLTRLKIHTGINKNRRNCSRNVFHRKQERKKDNEWICISQTGNWERQTHPQKYLERWFRVGDEEEPTRQDVFRFANMLRASFLAHLTGWSPRQREVSDNCA
jgi:hypothetical protein